MPVKSTEEKWSFEAHLFELDEFESICSDDLLSTGSLPSDDIWKKFEFCDLPLSEFSQSSSGSSFGDADLELEPLLEWSLDQRNLYGLDMINGCGLSKDTANEIRHHDCMWAGHCGSKEHKPESIKVSRPLLNQTTTTTTPPLSALASGGAASTTSMAKQRPPPVVPGTTSTSGRSLLLSSRNNSQNVRHNQQTIVANATTVASAAPTSARPDSPPSSDDDDHPRFKHEVTLYDQTEAENKTLQFLNDAISECDFDEDSDLCDYFEESDMYAGGPQQTTTITDTNSHSSCSYPGESDHSYHKGKGPQLRTDHLGVQTPSDSEEEIDVVSVGEKQQTTGRNCNTVLPTNPTIRDRQKLQRTVASAISNKREYNQPQTGGIKTRLPLRIPNTTTTTNGVQLKKNSSSSSSSSSSSGGSRNDNRRGVKRGRHRYQKSCSSSGGGGSPAKRRGYAHSSDSDTECSEKRSLHNNMERQRRVDLRNAFDDLRVLVPEVSCKERAAKVVILREAAAYCDFLGTESANQLKQVAELRRQQERLRSRLSQLRRSLAAKR